MVFPKLAQASFSESGVPLSEKLPPVRDRSCRAATAPCVVPFRD